MAKYESVYARRYMEGKGGHYDKAISNKFELMIWEIEKYFLNKVLIQYSGNKIKYLDFACGTGRIISYLGEFIEDRAGIDTSERVLEEARKKIPARFIRGNIIEDPSLLKGKKFDLITCFRLVLNLEDENRYLILKALKRYLSDDGYLVINNHMNRYSILGIIAFLIKSLKILPLKVEANRGQRGIINTLSEMRFRKILTECGYKIVKVYRFTLFPGHNSFMILPQRLLVPLEILISQIPLLNLFCKDQIYICKKM